MSRINDALKRARESQRPEVRSNVAPLRPIAEARQPEPGTGRRLAVTIIFLLVIAGLLIGLALFRRPVGKNVMAPQIATAMPVRSQTPTQTVAPVVAVMPATSPPTVIAAAPVAGKALRVQGIVADPVRPWAIVNGQTVHIGSLVGAMRVTEIAHDSVTFVGQGVTNRLHVGQ